MASNIVYYNKNILRDLKNWDILSNSSISGDNINISSGGCAGVKLSNDYFNGLKASNYRQITLSVQTSLNEQCNYQNYIELLLVGVYVDENGNNIRTYNNVNITRLDSSVSGNNYTITRVLEMEDYDFVNCVVYINNHTSNNIIITSCSMKRSQDVNSSQIGESIGWGITLSQVIAYIDGCEIYYDGVEQPDKLWYMEDDEGNFAGVNVNNERMIKFSKKKEILLD